MGKKCLGEKKIKEQQKFVQVFWDQLNLGVQNRVQNDPCACLIRWSWEKNFPGWMGGWVTGLSKIKAN